MAKDYDIILTPTRTIMTTQGHVVIPEPELEEDETGKEDELDG